MEYRAETETRTTGRSVIYRLSATEIRDIQSLQNNINFAFKVIGNSKILVNREDENAKIDNNRKEITAYSKVNLPDGHIRNVVL